MKEKIITYCIAFIILIIFIGNCFGQTKKDSLNIKEEYIFDHPETQPEFPGGEKELWCFIDKNLNKQLLYSIDTIGRSIASFTIDTTGSVCDIKIMRSLNPIIDNELLRIIKLMPKWKPGKFYDKPVEVKYQIPLKLPYENKFCTK